MGAKSTVRWASLVRRPSSIVRCRGSRLTYTMWTLLLLLILLSQLPESNPSLIEEPCSMITKELINSQPKDAEQLGSDPPNLKDVVKAKSTKQFSLYNDNEKISVKSSSTSLLPKFDTGSSAAVVSQSVNDVFLNGRKLTKNNVKTLDYLRDNTVKVNDSGPLTAQKNKNSSEQVSHRENNESLSRNIYPSKVFLDIANAKDESKRLGKGGENNNEKLSQIRNFTLFEQQNKPKKTSHDNMIDVIRSNRHGQKNGRFLFTGSLHALNRSTSNVFHTTSDSEEIDEDQAKGTFLSINNVEETTAGVEEIAILTKPRQNDHDNRERLRATTTFSVTNYSVEHDIIDFDLNTRGHESLLITNSSNKEVRQFQELMLSYHLQTDSFSTETTTFENVDNHKIKANQLLKAFEQLNQFDSVQSMTYSTESQYLSKSEAAPQQKTTTSSLNTIYNTKSELVPDKAVKPEIIETAPNNTLKGILNDTRPLRAYIGKTNSSLSKIIRTFIPLKILQSLVNYKFIEKYFTSSNITNHAYQFIFGDKRTNHTTSLSNDDNSSDNTTSAIYSKKMNSVTGIKGSHESDFLSVNTSTENEQNTNMGWPQGPKIMENFDEELVTFYLTNSSMEISESKFLNSETDSNLPLLTSNSTNLATFDALFVDSVSNLSEEALHNHTLLWNSSKPTVASNATRTFIPVNVTKQVNSTENTTPSSTTPDLTKIATFKSAANITNVSGTLTQNNSSNVIRIFGLLRITRGARWTPDLTKRYTMEYIRLSLILKELIRGVFIQSSLRNRLIEVEITKFSPGSIVVEFLLVLKEATSHDEVHVLSEVFLKGLGNESTLGKFSVDPWFTKFDVVSIRRQTPKTETTKDLPIPQWIIAVIVIATASLIFIVLFGAVAIYGRHHVRRRYGSRFHDEEEGLHVSGYKEWESKTAVGYENMAADDNHYNGEMTRETK
ncbi:uncharacterized protein LOC143232108 [Tachypleus tridentatus]|uniref:uncharacterized protein LOC143232108 n=1 Tax=Tachypleus tridentatus TaxID=6853 RepID=UPI003FD26D0C